MEATVSRRNLTYKKGLSYSIVYGFLCGPANSRKLRALLEAQGFRPALNSEEADILIAHSAGCWLIPKNARARLVLFVGMPLAQDKPWRTYGQANLQNVLSFVKDLKIITGLARVCLNVYYGVRQPGRNLAIFKQARGARSHILAGASHVFIANRHDPWPRSKQLDDLLASQGWAFIGLPGSHDNIWKHPDLYIPIISYYARFLV